MRGLIAAACLWLFALPSLAAPFVTVGGSNHPWDGGKVTFPCEPIWIDFYQPAPRSKLRSLLPRLEAQSVVALLDDEAVSVLDLTRQSGDEPPARTFLRQRIQNLEDARRRVLTMKEGSWSAVEDDRLAGLIAIYDNLRERPYRAYLVRALVADETMEASFDVDTCVGAVLKVSSHSRAKRPRADSPNRAALVIFLEKPPTNAVSEWTYDPMSEGR